VGRRSTQHRRSELPSTDTLDKAIAMLATTGDSGASRFDEGLRSDAD
jgi:hypothetical protein